MEQTSRWDKVKELFDAALQCEPSQRGEFLSDACGQDKSLQAEVESLISAHARSDGLSEHPWPFEFVGEAQGLTSIGPYRLIKKIGEGGMGQVWLAEQSAPLHRQVALKLIRAGMYDGSLLHRFQTERQSLALMDHPSIAHVFDAGATPDGRPYFVMEYVPGEPITGYCDRTKLNIQERLELFIKACEGVQHAHQKAIIHRDLKPANILVVETDGKPMPRIIDFGLAKAATSTVAGETLFTHAGGFVGTPGYMSPEQAEPRAADIDTRTDVYSLGVILYELLTGLLPFDAKQWQEQPLHEVMRQLREQDPPRPSTKVQTEKESSTTAAALRRTEPKQLASQLRGDLDWITMKALEKDRGRRYGTPSELAADIRRYLNNEPVVARPASAGYRMQKYLRRHRGAVSVAAGLVLLLTGFAGVQARQLRRITSERDRANRITEFMTGMFNVSDPSQARGNSITAREILDKASKDIDTGLAKDPALQSQMMFVMGKVYDNLGLYPRAESLLQRAIDIQRPVLGPENPETLTSMDDLAWTLMHEGHFPEADKLLRQTLDSQRRALGREHPDTLKTMSSLAWTLGKEGNYVEAEKLNRETLEIRTRVLGPENQGTLATMGNLAWILMLQTHYAESEKLNRETLDIRLRVLGAEHPDTLLSMTSLAGILVEEGRYAESEKLFRQTLDIRRRILGPEHPETVGSMNNLAVSLKRRGHLVEAETLYRQTLDISRRVLGPEHPETLMYTCNLAETLAEMGKYAEAKKLYQETLEIRQRVLGPEHPGTLDSTRAFAWILVRTGDYAEAEKLLRRTLETQRRVRDPRAAFTTYNLAAIAAHGGQRDEALSMLRDAIDHGLLPYLDLGMEQDPDLKSLHGDPRFEALVAHAKQSAAVQKSN